MQNPWKKGPQRKSQPSRAALSRLVTTREEFMREGDSRRLFLQSEPLDNLLQSARERPSAPVTALFASEPDNKPLTAIQTRPAASLAKGDALLADHAG